MRKSFSLLALILLPLVAATVGWQLGVNYERQVLEEKAKELEFFMTGATGSGHILQNPEEEVDLTLLWSVWRLLLANHIDHDTFESPTMLQGAVKGLVNSIDDPYTVFMNAKENDEFRSSLNGTLEGIGAELTMRDDMVTVVAPLKGSPAGAAGLKPSDVITAVDGESILGQGLHDVVSVIRGPKGTQVTLTIERPEPRETLDITITRAKIEVPSVEHELKTGTNGTIGYISVNQFGDDTDKEVALALEELKAQAPDAYILDLRYNGGGYLEKAVALTSMFLEKGQVVKVERKDREPEQHFVYGRPLLPEAPLVVLINEGSASASEILAGSLQDNERAKVMGKTSFGKGTIQEIFELPGGPSLRVTVAKWFTPNGRDLSKDGIMPDYDIEMTVEDWEADRDPQFDAAMRYLLEGIEPETPDVLSTEEETEE